MGALQWTQDEAAVEGVRVTVMTGTAPGVTVHVTVAEKEGTAEDVEAVVEATGFRMLPLPQALTTLLLRAREKAGAGPACDQCGAGASTDRPMLQCSACRRAKYCSADCQRKAWKAGHKKLCRARADTRA